MDGNKIIPKKFIFKYNEKSNKNSTKSVSAFSNIFRYKLLYDRGGYWVDMDMVCLKPFDFDTPYVFSSELNKFTNDVEINAGVIKAEKGNSFCKYAFHMCSKKNLSKLVWGEIGPKLVKESVERYNLQEYVQDYKTFCPLYYTELDLIITKCRTNLINSYAIHLWNDCWKRNKYNKNGNFDKLSIYEKLKQKYL